MIKAEVVADSLSPQGDRLISLLITFPRMILAEVNTHRMLSKNTSSSRAIPFEKMVEAIKNDPFIPIAWQKHHKGMQGSEYMLEDDVFSNMKEWLQSRDYAIKQASYLYERGVTKQLCNRLLEPWMWTTMLITGPMEGWNNFFTLRCPQYHTPVSGEGYYAKSWKELESWHSNEDNLNLLDELSKTMEGKLSLNKGHAEIHMMALAEAIYDAINESTPKQLESDEWHIPFEDKIDYNEILRTSIIMAEKDIKYHLLMRVKSREIAVMISTAMAARTSYTVVGDEKEVDYEKLIQLHDRLIAQDPPHSSPMEHCARAMTEQEHYQFRRGWITNTEESINSTAGWCRNFKGFIPYRHIIEDGVRL